jgi:DNA-binding LacI/PurR family transcriptional regulator
VDREEGSHARLYRQLAQRLRGEVDAGRYAGRLPPEPTLARELEVSRGTLRQALGLLVRDGVVYTIPGRGTFVGASHAGSQAFQGGAVGLVLPSIVRSRAQLLVSGVEETLRRAGYAFLLGTSGFDPALEAEQIERIMAQGACGLIVYIVDGPLDLPLLRRVVADGVPVVLVDRFVPDLAVDSVCVDNLGGAFMAVQHLAAQGYQRIGYIGTKNTGTSSIVERMAGYRWATDVYQLPVSDALVCASLHRLQGRRASEQEAALGHHNQEVLRRYLGGADRPEAVFVCNDYVAFQVYDAATALGRRIPDDLAIVGFDNVPTEDYRGVPLTTVDQPRHAIGATAARLLVDRLAGRRTDPVRVELSTHLIVRESSLRPAAHVPGPTARRAASLAAAGA